MMPDFDYQGHSVHYEVTGDGPPVVLLHCGGQSGRQWDRVVAALAHRYRLVVPDFFGFGETSCWRDSETLSHDDQALLAAEAVRRAVGGSAHLVGHSYGGACAIRLYHYHPELVDSLAVIEPAALNLLAEAGEPELHTESLRIARSFIAKADEGRDEEAWREFIDHYNSDGVWDAASDRAKFRLLAQTAGTAATLRSNFGNGTTLQHCRDIAVPVTVVSGETTSAYNRRVADLIHGEIQDSERVVIPGAGHMSPLTHPEPTIAMIERHLARVAAE
jgi:pimeloyl-ACP methyl ester carboxylesterase